MLPPSLFGLPRTIKQAANNKSESGSARLFPVAFLHHMSCMPLALLLMSLAEGWVIEHKQEQSGGNSRLPCEKELEKQKTKSKKPNETKPTGRVAVCPEGTISA